MPEMGTVWLAARYAPASEPAAGVASGMLIALGPSARGPVVAGTMAATIVANLLGDRTIWSALVFAVCNAGEAVIVAGLIEPTSVRPSASGGYSTCWDCWEKRGCRRRWSDKIS
jgi:hypothetical protein